MEKEYHEKSNRSNPGQLRKQILSVQGLSRNEVKRPAPAPLLLLAFNRPDLFEQVLNAARKAGARRVLVAVDGPRKSHPDDDTRCLAVRRIAESIDWATSLDCKFETSNRGCGPAISSAITWALSLVPEVIILEDDCLPDPSFLIFCDELLGRFRDDLRVMQIAGTNWGASKNRFGRDSYAFTSFATIWGWATWRRAWTHYEYRMDSWPEFKRKRLNEKLPIGRRFRRLLERDWEIVRNGGGTWDHQWQYSVMRNNGLSVCPRDNLVVNLGFRTDGTQHHGTDRTFSHLPLEQIPFPLHHPPEVIRNPSIESVFERIYWLKLGGLARLYRAILRGERSRKIARTILRPFFPRPT